MSDEYNQKNTHLEAQSSETMSDTSGNPSKDIDYVRPAELPEQDLYHGHSFITKWVFCQDAKIIGIQYFLTAVFTGIVGLVLSWLMRLQLGYPDLVPFITAEHYYQFVTMHGMIMVVYFLTAFIDVLKNDEKLAAVAYFQSFWTDDIYQQWIKMGGTN